MIFIISSIQKDDLGLGFENDLLFKIPADLKRFKDLTMGHPVIMGRRTWESLPEKFRPLPGRTNIVVTSTGLEVGPLVLTCNNLDEAISEAKKIDSEIAVIGGARVFAEALPHADTLYLTEIEGQKEADTYFPEFKNTFEEIRREGPFETSDGIKYWFVEYRKKD